MNAPEPFVLYLASDPHAIPALAAYAEACAADQPELAADLRSRVAIHVTAANRFIDVPETTLPGGLVVPAFRVAQYLAGRGPAGIPLSVPEAAPWVDIDYREARQACEAGGYRLLTESQALAIAWDIAHQDINWTGGKVGEGSLYQGLHKGTVSEAQPASIEPADTEERRWHQLSNGERLWDFAGNAYSWIFDDIQGDDEGLVTKSLDEASPSIATAPHPSMKKGMGWRPEPGADWSGRALVRGGCWYSEADAGVFNLDYGWPDYRYGIVGFRCTQPIGL